MFAIQNIQNGNCIEVVDSMADAQDFLQYAGNAYEIINTSSVSHLKVIYTELGGPWGYGHQEVSFLTYGGITRCVISFYKWVQDTCKVFGPDWRDVYDYFRHCNLYVNGKDKSEWFYNQLRNHSKKQIFVLPLSRIKAFIKHNLFGMSELQKILQLAIRFLI